MVDVSFDPAKDAANIAKHGLSLAEFAGFDGEAIVVADTRYDYGESRYQLRGRIGGRGYCAVVVFDNDVLRLISFRRAHDKEMRRHE